jgi:hypothetical protein
VLPTSELQRSSARDGMYTAGPVMESFGPQTASTVRTMSLRRNVYRVQLSAR